MDAKPNETIQLITAGSATQQQEENNANTIVEILEAGEETKEHAGTKPVCICGKELQTCQAQLVYNGRGARCNKCRKHLKDDIIYHCEKSMQHKGGYDLCMHCSKKPTKIDCYCGGKLYEIDNDVISGEKCDECQDEKNDIAYICVETNIHCGPKYLCDQCKDNHKPKSFQKKYGTVCLELQRKCLEDLECAGCSTTIKIQDFVYQYSKISLCKQCAEEPPIVCELHEDIWSLAYVMIRSGKKQGISCFLKIFMFCIYSIQLLSLIFFIWGANLELDRNVIVQYSIEECQSTYLNDTDIFNFCDEIAASNVTYTMGLVEKPSHDEKYRGLHYTPSWGRMHVFGFTALLSMSLLTVYILSSINNSIQMLTIASKDEHINIPDASHCSSFLTYSLKHLCNCCNNPLRLIPWMNILLSLFAYMIALWLITFYSEYYGIQNPTEIILTPIGIVFILEVDDWAFVFIRRYFKESNKEHLWQFHVTDFPEFEFQKAFRTNAVFVLMIWIVFFYISVPVTVLYMNETLDQSDDVHQAAQWQFYMIWLLICILMLCFTANVLKKLIKCNCTKK